MKSPRDSADGAWWSATGISAFTIIMWFAELRSDLGHIGRILLLFFSCQSLYYWMRWQRLSIETRLREEFHQMLESKERDSV